MTKFMCCHMSCNIQMLCPFTGPKMFCVGPNFLSQSKNLTAFSASSKTFVRSVQTEIQLLRGLYVMEVF